MFGLLNRVSEYRKLFGPPGVFLALRMRLQSADQPIQCTPIGLKHPIYIRPKTSDIVTLQKVWRDQEYAFTPATAPKFIIDAGANIGIASIYFAQKFPDAKIVAIEPESRNFALLEKNTRPYPNISPLHAALWNSSGEIDLIDPGQGAWGFRTATKSAQPLERVRAITLDDLLRQHAVPAIDILKIDIEGAEKEIFEHSATWITNVHAILIELHDRFRPGCSRAFWTAVSAFPQEQHRGETIFVAK